MQTETYLSNASAALLRAVMKADRGGIYCSTVCRTEDEDHRGVGRVELYVSYGRSSSIHISPLVCLDPGK